MIPLVGLMYMQSNINVWKTIKAAAAFVLASSVTFWYLNFCDFNHVLTSLLVSLLFGFVFCMGFTFSAIFRAACLVFLVQTFSLFGLFNLFLSISWITIVDMLSGIVTGIRNFRKLAVCRDGSDTSEQLLEYDNEIGLLISVVSFLHYITFVPYLMIFIYSLCYECTFMARRHRDRNEGKNCCVTILQHCLSFIIGFIVSVVLTLFVVQWMIIRSLSLDTAETASCKNIEELSMNSSTLFFYVLACMTFIVIAPFSRFILRAREHIVLDKIDYTSGTATPMSKNVYITKNKRERKSYENIKMQQRRKHLQENVSDDSSIEQSQTAMPKSQPTTRSIAKAKLSKPNLPTNMDISTDDIMFADNLV